MVLDIRKELRQRKAGHPITAQQNSETAGIKSRRAGMEEEDREAESIAGPCSSPAPVYSRKIDLLSPSAYDQPRSPQPRPLRMPCSACTFVPAHSHNIQHNINLALLSQSQNDLRAGRRRPQMYARQRNALYDEACIGAGRGGAGGADECIEYDEPGAEEIAMASHGCNFRSSTTRSGTQHSTSHGGGDVSYIQPIRVGCSACTSSLRAPLSYGQSPDHVPPVKSKLLRKKRDKRPLLESSSITKTAEDMAAQKGRQDVIEQLSTALESSCGWFVRPEQDVMTNPPSTAAAGLMQHYNTSIEVEGVGGANQYESALEVTYQSTRDCEEMMPCSPAVKLRKHNEKGGHDCFVKRVERACATAARSTSAGGKLIRAHASYHADHPPAPARRDYRRPASQHTNRQRRPNSTDPAAAAAAQANPLDIEQYVASAPASPFNEAEDRGGYSRQQHFITPAAGADAVENIIPALVSQDDGPISSCLQHDTVLRKELQNVRPGAAGRPATHCFPSHYQKKKLNARSGQKACGNDVLSRDVFGHYDADSGGAAQANPTGYQGREAAVGQDGTSVRAAAQLAAAASSGADVSKPSSKQASRRNSSKALTGDGCAAISRGMKAGSGNVASSSMSSSKEHVLHAAAGGDEGGHVEVSGTNPLQQQQQELKLSVEVFPSPSAPKGFGLKITQHLPKAAPVQVEYVNGLGLSPRSFQTLPCHRCSASSN